VAGASNDRPSVGCRTSSVFRLPSCIMTVPPATRETWRSQARGISRIESELLKLEHGLALAQAESQTRLPVRTSVLNLVVYVHDESEMELVRGAVAGLVGRHPSRTIYLMPGASQSGEVEAELRAYCLAASIELMQNCVEEICLRTGPLRSGYLPELISPLLVSDLPTCAWYPRLNRDSASVLAGLAELADQVVVDSAGAVDAAADLRILGPFGRQITDFTWLRLLPWCELTAQFFDSEPSRHYLEQITRLQIEYSGSTTASALYAGWLADRLGWEPFPEDRAPLVRFFRRKGEPGQFTLMQLLRSNDATLLRGTILGITLQAQRPSAAPARFQIRRSDSGTSAQTISRLHNGRESERTAPLPSNDLSSLLAEALDVIRPSRVYRGALKMALRFLGS
jgi:glucose-6-phosphate dehydrogenase assembly protein OpcA